jgi:hypothetical protein
MHECVFMGALHIARRYLYLFSFFLLGCATMGAVPVPYEFSQSGKDQPFGFSVRTETQSYIEFQGNELNDSTDLVLYVRRKAQELCKGDPLEFEYYVSVWTIARNGLNQPATGFLPVRPFSPPLQLPKVSALVSCRERP